MDIFELSYPEWMYPNNREISMLIWLSVVLIFVLAKKEIRSSFFQVLVALTAKPILTSLTLMVCYICLMVLLLIQVGLWNISQLKATILWSLTVGCLLLFGIQKIREEEEFFQKAVRDNFKLTVIFDFFVNMHMLPLVVEIIFVPTTTLFGMMIALAETKKKFGPVKKFLNGHLILFVLCLLVYAIWQTAVNFGQVAKIDTILSFVIPVILSFLYLPFLFFAVVYMEYETIFSKLTLLINDEPLRKYAKRSLLKKIRLNTSVLKDWIRVARENGLNSRKDMDESIEKVFAKLIECKNSGKKEGIFKKN